MNISIFGVVSVKLISFTPNNSKARTVRITSQDYDGNEMDYELTLFGETDDLDSLPKSSGYRDDPAPFFLDVV